MPRKVKNTSRAKIGDIFGSLTIKNCPEHCFGTSKVLVSCKCGTEKSVLLSNLIHGFITHCGNCLNENISKAAKLTHTTHGKSTRGACPAYTTWRGMMSRCRNPNDGGYRHYGARGIMVCERWLKFENFYADMGDRPPKYSLDRIDNNGPYSPENCRWTCEVTQKNNRRNNINLTYKGVTKTITEWARLKGVPAPRFLKRFHSGWPAEKIIET